ncbi:TIGR01777 family protein [bacterium CG17_big_fil_post_rev_8_21_14_2_50_64_8]|nr:MAG: TIGR01777 family protein [bacterium CG17_big_fil_post_rev_8_21_14_2_50_64_8]PJA74013.1 MAG: TIGR01777 family protein [bacterium CG_4_9_14_3_um_filter_65_15]
MRVFITGATGLIGRNLTSALVAAGHGVLCISRDAARGRDLLPPQVEVIEAEPAQPGHWQERVGQCDAVVNLAGSPVASGRWTRSRRRVIRSSRLATTAHLAAALSGVEHPVTFISASAVGYYGDAGETAVGENDQPGNDFLARLAVEWEHTALQAESDFVRCVRLRIGVVLAPDGGVLDRMVPLYRRGLGGPLGSGKQYLPWIHIADMMGAIQFILEQPEMVGPVNASVPDPCRQREFAQTLGRVLGKPAVLPAPAMVLRLVLGQMAEMVLNGQRVVPKALRSAGYRFRFPELEPALRDVLGCEDPA